ncbi:centlein [Hyperolius riggenbachi]|uniref:centlein n=1 Tax=Hyperolius riggenbachi TaxID=752182 RepID=UPI0035A29EE8
MERGAVRTSVSSFRQMLIVINSCKEFEQRCSERCSRLIQDLSLYFYYKTLKMAVKQNSQERILQLEEEINNLTEELSQCQADKEFVWSLWKRLQVANPDLTQAISLVVEREKNKAEAKDRKVLEILQTKDSQIQQLEESVSGQQQEINNLVQRKIAVDEENTILKQELDDLQVKLKDKSQELKNTTQSLEKKEEQRAAILIKLKQEKEDLSKKCADLLSDLEKARKQEAQWRGEKSGIDAKIKVLEINLKEAGNQMDAMHNKINSLSSQVAVKQTELAQKEVDVIRLRKELQELQNLYKQSNEHAAQQSDLIQQLQALSMDTQKVLRSQEDAHITETLSHQKLYNDLNACYENAKSCETQLRQSNSALTEQLHQKEQYISQLQVKLQEALNALPKPPQEPQELEDPSVVELELIIASQKSEIKFLQDKLEAADLQLTRVNNCRSAALENSILRAGRMREVQPVKRSRSLSPKGFSRESEELKKLKIAEKRIEHLEKTLQIKIQENAELQQAHENRKERLVALQAAYRALKQQIEEDIEGGLREKVHKKKPVRADPAQLRHEDSDAVWNELAYFKRENKKLSVEKMNLEEEIDQLKVQASIDRATIQELNACLQQERQELLLRLDKEENIRCSTPKKSTGDTLEYTLHKVSYLKNKLLELETDSKKLSDFNEELNKQNKLLKSCINALQKDTDIREQKMQKMHSEIEKMRQVKESMEKKKDELNREVLSLKRLLADSNTLRNINRDLLRQVHVLQCTLNKATALVPHASKNFKKQGHRKEATTKVKQNAANKISLRRHQAFLNQSIKVMSSVFENFSKDGWEDVSEDSNTHCFYPSETEDRSSESLDQVMVKSIQSTDSTMEETSTAQESNCDEMAQTDWSKKDKCKEYVHKAGISICRPKNAGQFRRGQVGVKCGPLGRKVQKERKPKSCPCSSLTSLLERVASLQQQVSILQRGKQAAMASVNKLKLEKIKLAAELQLAQQRLQISKQMAKKLSSDVTEHQHEKENLLRNMEQMTEQLAQAKRSLEMVSPPTLDQPALTHLTPSKSADVEVKQLQKQLKNLTVEMAKQSTTIKAMKNEVLEKEERIRELEERVTRMERDVNMKRHLIEDLKTRLKTYQENERSSKEMLESLERKVKATTEECAQKKTSIDSLKQRLNVITKEKSQYEQMYYKITEELEKKNIKIGNLEGKMTEAEHAMSELETTAKQQLHNLAMQSDQALGVMQNKLLHDHRRMDELVAFIKSLAKELQTDVCEIRIHIKEVKILQEPDSGPSKHSVHKAQSLAASILNISHSDLSDILDVPDEDETANVKQSVEYDKEWMNHIMKLLEGQLPFAACLMDIVRSKLNEKKRLVEEYALLKARNSRGGDDTGHLAWCDKKDRNSPDQTGLIEQPRKSPSSLKYVDPALDRKSLGTPALQDPEESLFLGSWR